MRLVAVMFLSSLTACGGFGSVQCPDVDANGVCDADEACEADADGDGICNEDDICPKGPDDVDADADGVPDACDPCPQLEGGDSDGDGTCDAVDPCVDDADDACDVPLFVAVQVDGFPEGSSWVLRDPSGNELDRGGFSGPGAGYITRPTVPATGLSCVTVEDDDGNGGIRGRIFSRQLGVVYAEWDFYDWTTRRESFCFEPASDGEAVDDIPTEAEFLDESNLCDVRVVFETGIYAEEHAWVLQRPNGDRLAGWEGSWTNNPQYTSSDADTTDTQTFVLAPGAYQIKMVDRYGDGWDGDAFPDHAAISVKVGNTEVMSEQLTAEECAGAQPCTRLVDFTASNCN